jgi:hypothetical protein
MFEIKMKKDYFGKSSSWESFDNPLFCDTAEAAQAKIIELDNTPYYAGNNEAGRPEYKAFKIKKENGHE